MNKPRCTYCLRSELRPETKSSSVSSLSNLETRSSTNWSSWFAPGPGLKEPFDEVVELELELGKEPVIMAVNVFC